MAYMEQTGRPDDLDKPQLRDVDGWVHHVADLDGDVTVRTVERDRPVSLSSRLVVLKDLVGSEVPLGPAIFRVAERSLSPRSPYVAAPLSYLNAVPPWALWGQSDRLEWTNAFAQRGQLAFWFRDVVPGTSALVVLDVTVGASPGTTGTFEVRSSDAAPRQFPVTGFRDHTVDLLVRPTSPFAVLVEVKLGPGIDYFAFREVTYRTLS